ncbi:MAG: hypothetical protein HOG05_10585, partial [Bacteroidetes bacterium]|nr:hypothetical protein [Bacteroidota bacterium]
MASYYNDPSNPNSIAGNYINQVFIDQHNLVWVATNNGISILDQKNGKFTALYDAKNINPLKGIPVNCIIQDKKGNYWFGTEIGLYKFATKEKNFTHYTSNTIDLNALSGNSISYLLEDRNGNIWVGTQG